MQRVLADQREPVLIVLDTLARCFVGGEENSARDSGLLIAAASTIQRQTEAAVLLVHHTGKTNLDIERGSSALRDAADVMIRQKKDLSGLIRVSNDKQKDADEFPPVSCRLCEVVVPRRSIRRHQAVSGMAFDTGRPCGHCGCEPCRPRGRWVSRLATTAMHPR